MDKPKVYKDENACEGQWVAYFPSRWPLFCHHRNWRGAFACALKGEGEVNG